MNLVPDERKTVTMWFMFAYQWHYMPTSTIKLTNEIDQVKATSKKNSSKRKIKKSIINHNNEII